MNDTYDSIIIGSGIAGMSAAIYLKRYNMNVLILEKEIPGGQIVKASIVENYPGFLKIDGATLSTNIYEQVLNLGVSIKYEQVLKIDEQNKIVFTSNKEYKAKTIIIATGRSPKQLNIGEENYIGNGISYCATCDGMFYKDEEVIVIGGGNSAIEEAIYLSTICKKVTILNRSNNLKADQLLQNQILQHKNIKILYNSEINEIITNQDKICGIKTKNKELINCCGIFVYIGLNPNVLFLKNSNIKLEKDYVIVDKNQKTNIEGIYAIGDVTKKELYQLITSASEGAIAADHIKKNIMEF